MWGEEGAGSRESPWRKSPAEGKTEFSDIDSSAGNGFGVISPLQLDKITASMTIPMATDRVLMQASDAIFSRVHVLAGTKVYTSLLYHLKAVTRTAQSVACHLSK